MKNILFSIITVLVITTSIYLIGKFFDIQPEFYIPYIFWLNTLVLFYTLLDTHANNIFMKDI